MDLLRPRSSFPGVGAEGMETGGGRRCQPEPGLGLSCCQRALRVWAGLERMMCQGEPEPVAGWLFGLLICWNQNQ